MKNGGNAQFKQNLSIFAQQAQRESILTNKLVLVEDNVSQLKLINQNEQIIKRHFETQKYAQQFVSQKYIDEFMKFQKQ